MEGHGLSEGSEALGLSFRVRRAAPSLQTQAVEPVEASHGTAKTATLTIMLAHEAQGSPGLRPCSANQPLGAPVGPVAKWALFSTSCRARRPRATSAAAESASSRGTARAPAARPPRARPAREGRCEGRWGEVRLEERWGGEVGRGGRREARKDGSNGGREVRRCGGGGGIATCPSAVSDVLMATAWARGGGRRQGSRAGGGQGRRGHTHTRVADAVREGRGGV